MTRLTALVGGPALAIALLASPLSSPARAADPQPAVTGSWRPFNAGPLSVRNDSVAVWTGTEMIVIGGINVENEQLLTDGAAYNPTTDTWRSIASLPNAVRPLSAVWTGNDVIVWSSATFVLSGTLTDGMAYNV